MIVVGLIVIFAVLGLILALVAYSANNRKRAAQSPHATVVSDTPHETRAPGPN